MVENFLLHVVAILLVGYILGKLFGIFDLIEWLFKPWGNK